MITSTIPHYTGISVAKFVASACLLRIRHTTSGANRVSTILATCSQRRQRRALHTSRILSKAPALLPTPEKFSEYPESALIFANWYQHNLGHEEEKDRRIYVKHPEDLKQVPLLRKGYDEAVSPAQLETMEWVKSPHLLSPTHSYAIHSNRNLPYPLMRKSFYKRHFLGQTIPWIHGSTLTFPATTDLRTSSSIIPFRRGCEILAEVEDASAMVNLKKILGAAGVVVLPTVIQGVPFMFQAVLVDEIFPRLEGEYVRSHEPINVMVNPDTIFRECAVGVNGRSTGGGGGMKPLLDIVRTADGAHVLNVYVDGCCLSNGRSGSRGGIGVYFADGSIYNVSRDLLAVEAEFQKATTIRNSSTSPITTKVHSTKPQSPAATNNRAELSAAITALQQVHRLIVHHGYLGLIDILHIYSDSEYVVKGFTQYLPKWKNSGTALWTRSDGAQVVNQDLWMMLDRLVSLGRSVGLKVSWSAIPREDNVEADLLSKAGAAGEDEEVGIVDFARLVGAGRRGDQTELSKELFGEIRMAKPGLKTKLKKLIEPRVRVIREGEWRIMGLPHPSFKITR